MCLDCIRKRFEEQQAGNAQAMAHLDALGVPEDSLVRGLAEVTIACNIEPYLGKVMMSNYSMKESLMQ